MSDSDNHCRMLFHIAYRMLDRVTEEEMGQETMLRWHRADTSVVREPQARLSTHITCLCIDQLRLVRRQSGDTSARGVLAYFTIYIVRTRSHWAGDGVVAGLKAAAEFDLSVIVPVREAVLAGFIPKPVNRARLRTIAAFP